MYRVNAEQWVDLEILEDLNIDSESGISFANIGFDHFKKMVKISMVSNPVVTAVESNCICKVLGLNPQCLGFLTIWLCDEIHCCSEWGTEQKGAHEFINVLFLILNLKESNPAYLSKKNLSNL